MGAASLAALIVLLPTLGETDSLIEFVSAYVLVLSFTGTLLYGLLGLAADLAIGRLLVLAAATAVAGMAATYLGGSPETLIEGPAVMPLTLLFLADAFKLGAAVCVGLALAQRITSPGVALLIASLATAADLYSFLAGPTKSLVGAGPEGAQTLLSYLLVWFPTFGFPLGFALGVSDFIFLALFAATAGYLGLRHPLPTLVSGCVATLVTMLAGLLLQTALPALPFIALSFVIANAAPLYRSFSDPRNT